MISERTASLGDVDPKMDPLDDEDPLAWIARGGAPFVMRRIRDCEPVDLLHLASLPGQRSSVSGSLRPLPLYFHDQNGGGRHAVLVREGDDADVGKVVGVAALRPVEAASDLADLVMFVIPDQRRQGLGRKLFDRLVAVARRAGIRRLRIQLPERDADVLGHLSHLSTHATLVRDGAFVRIEIPDRRGRIGLR